MSETDRELIRACQQGETRAWEHLVTQYERLVYSIPLNYGLSHEDAADITQLTFTLLIQHLDNLREDSNLAGWLATVARRHTWRLLARRRREHPPQSENLTDIPTLLGSATTNPMETWERLAWLDQGLAQLDQRCRELLQALYFDEHQPSYEEIAARLGMPIGSIGPTRARCLARLKKILEESS